MAKRKKKFPIKKKETEVRQIFKTEKGIKKKYVNVTIRGKGRTINKQFKYRGGKFDTYLKEAQLQKGTRYYINYRTGEIKQPEEVKELVKQVRADRKAKSKQKKGKKAKKIKKKEILKKFSIIPKRTYKAPEPIGSKSLVELLKGKIDYEREHSIMEFSTKQQEDQFLMNLFARGTRNKADARRILANFSKVRLKMSYAFFVDGINVETGAEERLLGGTTIGKKPFEIYRRLKENGLTPGEDIIIDSPRLFKLQTTMHDFNIGENINKGTFRITNVTLAVKFVNDTQRTLV